MSTLFLFGLVAPTFAVNRNAGRDVPTAISTQGRRSSSALIFQFSGPASVSTNWWWMSSIDEQGKATGFTVPLAQNGRLRSGAAEEPGKHADLCPVQPGHLLRSAGFGQDAHHHSPKFRRRARLARATLAFASEARPTFPQTWRLPGADRRRRAPVARAVGVEIGAGQGALTEYLLERADRVIAIEVDPELVKHLLIRFAGRSRGLKVVASDILATDLTQWGHAVVVGNLPYYITSPVVERTLAMGKYLERAVFLIQKEVAERITAVPCTRDYGFLSVATQLSAETKLLFKVPPGAFSPPPKVDSAVIRLTPRRREGEAPPDPTPLLAFVGLCFRQKRKTLRNNLTSIFGKETIDPLPEANMRAEQLTLDQFRDLYRRLTGS